MELFEVLRCSVITSHREEWAKHHQKVTMDGSAGVQMQYSW
ncbi:hypothetical protein [Oribacterium sp. WCC10]|nr:hypothetical protein [Oribacterium sp. WCC10]